MNAPEDPARACAPAIPSRRIEELPFENRYATLPDRFHTRLRPTPLPDPYLVAFNPDAAALIGLDPTEAERPEFAAYFAGNLVPPGAEPLAAVYAGHQFGVWVPQLGDGRAILLGEVRGPQRSGRWDVQLKGSGRTPYSRMGDGRAVLRSAIREYLGSEAMHGLGIPTTRALAIVGSDAPVIREQVETAAVLTRMAPTHVRFGTFEFFCWSRQPEAVRTLADHVLADHYAELAGEPDAYVRLFTTVVERTARLIADWMAVGFCHGVMNTDNLSIIGLTIDYGPFGFLDGFDWGHVCNHSDDAGRYAYRMQPGIAHWNLGRLAQALSPLVPAEAAQAALARFEPTFLAAYGERMTAKLGLEAKHDEDDELVRELLALMHESRTDYTIFFRRLARFDDGDRLPAPPLRDFFVDRERFDAWAQRYRERLAWESSDAQRRRQRMNRVNPKYVLRNHLAEVAIRKARDERDYGEIERLRRLLARPFDEQPEMEAYAALPPDWAGSIAVSCSS
jgi:uncharacterized protein YdiU (UPF0061 family)